MKSWDELKLNFITPWANSPYNKLIFSMETIYMKCQSLFSGKKYEKKFSIAYWKFTQHAKP